MGNTKLYILWFFQVPCQLSGRSLSIYIYIYTTSDHRFPTETPPSEDLGGATTLILKLTRKLSFFREKRLFFPGWGWL